jgi:dihydroneopterin aldolase
MSVILTEKDRKMATIFIEGLEVYTLIGVYDFERTDKQKLKLDLTIKYPLKKAGKSDNLDDTLNYAQIATDIEQFAASSSFKLLEAFGYHLKKHLQQKFKIKVKIKITKFILPNTQGVGIII